MQTRTTSDESLADAVQRLEHAYCSRTTPGERKAKGQVFTPAPVASFMAGMFSAIPPMFRLLDPGAGLGALTAAVCERISRLSSPCHLHVTAFESDETVIPFLNQTLNRCERVLGQRGHIFTHELIVDDFLIRAAQAIGRTSLFGDDAALGPFDAVIVNPPYFKIGGESLYAKLLPAAIHGQPNIYALFLAMSAQLLCPGGELVAITPRSFCNGLYFRAFRQWFFRRMSLARIHLFESRTETFKEAKILQESVVTLTRRDEIQDKDVLVTRSFGRDLGGDLDYESLPATLVFDKTSQDSCVRIPETSADTRLVEEIEKWPCQFSELGLRISTGPVVTFRATKYLRQDLDASSVPLLLVHNVRPFKTIWPLRKNGKPTAFHHCQGSVKYLVPAGNYVLLRRFSAKEERRRLTASCLHASFQGGCQLALENHLNYVYHASRELQEDEVLGLAALFNSTLLDRYFRAISGNTQVNATEVRSMRFPDLATIRRIGSRVEQQLGGPESADEAVLCELGIDRALLANVKGDRG